MPNIVMKYCGNFKHLIKPQWIQSILQSKGTLITPFHDYVDDPAVAATLLKQRYIPERVAAKNQAQQDLFLSGVYDSNLIMAEMFTADNLPFQLELGEVNRFLKGDWWTIKQMPGQFMPMHRDTAKPVKDNHRFWFPWVDYEPGHVFLHQGKFIDNYSAGDLFQYYEDDDLHGSVNLSLNPRIIMQISEHVITC